jgi:hypothetical protein
MTAIFGQAHGNQDVSRISFPREELHG